MMGLGIPELLIIMVIALVIFGAGKLPEIGSSLGKSIANFKKASAEQEQTPRVLPKEETTPDDKRGSAPQA